MTEQRDRIVRHITDNPGVYFNQLVRQLDLAQGQAQYHLRRLLRNSAVDDVHLYGYTHYFPPEADEWERGAFALARRETARDVILYLVGHGPSSPADVVAELEIARSTLEWHLDHLIEQNIVEKHRDAQRRVTVTLTRPTATVRVLSEVAPSVSGRMVDRFTRLVDEMLEEAD